MAVRACSGWARATRISPRCSNSSPQTFREPFIAQKYLPDVRKGDKRIILVDGKAAGAINRVPAVNENRSNMHVGGKAEPTHMTKREHEICEALGRTSRRAG